MADQRRLDTSGSVTCRKRPRLEADPGHVLVAGTYRSGGLPGYAAEGHYSYQGTYFSYPLQCHKSPELLTQWSPSEPYVNCMDGTVNQQLRSEKAHRVLFRRESETYEMWVQNSSYAKNQDCLVGDPLVAQEKWANYMGHADVTQQGWNQRFPVPCSTRAPTGWPPLAIPKPVYRNHVYCTDTDYSPKGSLASGMLADIPSKHPADTDWSLPSSAYPVHGGCGNTAPPKAPVAESGFRPFHQSWKDAVASPAGFSPYQSMFENLQVAPSAFLADASHASGCDDRKSVPEECARSPCRKASSKLPPAGSPSAGSQGFIYQERSSACYPLPPYPLTSHEQLALYQQNVAQAEKQKALFALSGCKSFNCPTGEEPKLLPKTYAPPAPKSYSPGQLESYFYRSSPVTSPGLKTSWEQTSQQNSQSKSSFEQRNPVPVCSVTEKASCGNSSPGQEVVPHWSRANSMGEPANESFRCRQVAPQPQAFHPLQPAEKLSSWVNGYNRTQEAKYGVGLSQSEKGPSREGGSLYVEKQFGLSSDDQKRSADNTPRSGARVVIPDSPVASHDSCLRGDSPRARQSEGSGSSIRHAPQPQDREPKDLKQLKDPLRPCSPPMPVIHNVFSLAPYREYLEGTATTLQLPSSEVCPAEKPSLPKSWQSEEGETLPRPPSAGLSRTPGALLDGGKETTCEAESEDGRKDPSGSYLSAEREGRSCAGFCENYQARQNAPAASLWGSTGGVSELANDNPVLDLSLKTEGLADVPHVSELAGKSQAPERENSKRHDVKKGPAKEQAGLQETDSPTLPLLHKSSLEEKGNFQSSAAFLYKKFKILKCHTAGSNGAVAQGCPSFQSTSHVAALSDNFCPPQGSEQSATGQKSLAMPQTPPPAWQSCRQAVAQQNGHQTVTQQNSLPVQQGCQRGVTQQNSQLAQQNSQQVATRQNSPQMATRQNSLSIQQNCHQTVTQQNSLPVQQGCQRVATQQNSQLAQQNSQQVATQQNSLPIQQNCHQTVTQQNSLPVQQGCQQVVTQQNSQLAQQNCLQSVTLLVQQTCQQVATQQNSLPVRLSCLQAVTQQSSLLVQLSSPQVATRRNSLPAQQNLPQTVTRQNSLPALQVDHGKSAQPNTRRLPRKCRNVTQQPDASKLLPPPAPAGSPALGEVSGPLPPSCESPAQQRSSKRYFTALHGSLCAIISDSVSTSAPEQLREWLEKAEAEREPKPKAASSAKAKSGPKTPGSPKPSKTQQVWLAFKDVAGLLNQLISQLETFLFIRHCPFPHVVRAGTIFVPIHVVKEKLFGNLPGASVDHVLQHHKVELRPTTLSEEKLLRERDLKTCPSRMLKLLALKQLPGIYPDLLDLHWQYCVKQQLGEPTEEIQNGDLKAAGTEGLGTAEVARCLRNTPQVFSLGVRGKHKPGGKCEPIPSSPSKTHRPIVDAQGTSPSSRKSAASMPTKEPARNEVTSGVLREKRFPFRSGAKRLLFRASQLSGALRVKLTDGVARSTSKLLSLRKSVVRIKSQNALQERQGRPVPAGKKRKRPTSLHLKGIRRRRMEGSTSPRRRRMEGSTSPSRLGYPELVGRRISHLYEEKDKSKAWYQGMVLRVHKRHKDPLQTVYEVTYDCEPEWRYYLEILQDYQKGWLEVE
ncbi:uncharacterized protein C15orf39 homolog isoform X1 [Sphaerodactylus townsendi]|uniref:uncharacterized protein C15orf39 homolog isoform X1 n=1 Tax=Sphaerodactylus townsendi TaxID=933632 RepID=UPI002026059F|nr:uncharacterized protein C15orf39 homolog isoform X1 [Sphaerodactylus townsendi]